MIQKNGYRHCRATSCAIADIGLMFKAYTGQTKDYGLPRTSVLYVRSDTYQRRLSDSRINVTA